MADRVLNVVQALLVTLTVMIAMLVAVGYFLGWKGVAAVLICHAVALALVFMWADDRLWPD